MITDERMEQLLRETFQAHEHLVDQPPRASEAVRRRGHVLAAVLVSAALGAGGLYGGVWLKERNPPVDIMIQGPGRSVSPTGRDVRTDAQNKVANLRILIPALAQARARLLDAPGGTEPASSSEVSPLREMTMSGGLPNALRRSEFFLSDTSDQHALAKYLAARPPDRFFTEGADGLDPDLGIGDNLNADGSHSEYVIWQLAGVHEDDSGTVSMLVQLTPVGDRTGIRLTAYGNWVPARPAESFLDDEVTRIVLVSQPAHFVSGRVGPTRRETITDPDEIGQIVRTYNSLPGTQDVDYTCRSSLPTQVPQRLRATFHTADRDLSIAWTGGCGATWSVTVDGRVVAPNLRDIGGFWSTLDGLTGHL